MSKLLAKLFGGAAGGVVEKLTGIADKFIQTKDEKAAFEKEMTQIFIQAEAEMQKNVTDRWKADLEHGNWLTRSVRPLGRRDVRRLRQTSRRPLPPVERLHMHRQQGEHRNRDSPPFEPSWRHSGLLSIRGL